MKSLTKRACVYALIVAVITALVFGTGVAFGGIANALVPYENIGYDYFYNQIAGDSRAQKFYKAFESLENDGEFKHGKVEVDLVASGVVDGGDVIAYVNEGDGRIPKAYTMGRDAYFMDNPDLFYADVFETSISAGQKRNDEYVAFMDTSRADTLYLGNLDTPDKINAAIARYNDKVNEIVNGARAAGGVKEQIEYVNRYIAEHTEYSFCSSVVNGQTVYEDGADYISTAYGSLVNGKAICGGYSKGFKAVMDRLGIPCVCVQGYARATGKTTFEPHMWNYVKIDSEGVWYAVDTTWNATGNKTDKWLLVGENSMASSHIEDGIFSSSGEEFKYPALKPYDFGVDTDGNGMEIKGTYFETTDEGTDLTITVSYENKGAKKLEEEGKYLAFRMGDKSQDGTIVWDDWFNFVVSSDFMFAGFDYDDEKSTIYLHAGIRFIQFAIIDYAPDVCGIATYPDRPEYGELAGKPCYYAYDGSKLTDEHLGTPSAPYENAGYGTFYPAPGAVVTPTNSAPLSVNGTYEIKAVYNTSLKLVEGKTEQDIDIEFYTSRGNDTVKENATVEDIKWDGDKTITFKFTPSKMYIHNLATYYFYPTNLIGGRGNKSPSPFTYSFKGKSVVCSRIFNDGRQYMDVFGEPKVLDTSDLSMSDFKDESGNYYAQNQRSQLLLVASKPDAAKEAILDETLKSQTQITDEDIVASTTYEIDLQICGVVQHIPNGSYLQVSFGFPEGYSPDDEGTTFKIYHYKHDAAGNITGVEEIPVVVTKYGLIAQVRSFSPFTIVQLKNTCAEVAPKTAKSVYASVNGKGGSISTTDSLGITQMGGGIAEISDSLTFNLIADEGYRLAGVFLNGKAVDMSSVTNGSLVLNASEIEDNNMLEAVFVTEESAQSYADRGITVKAVAAEKPAAETQPDPDDTDNDNNGSDKQKPNAGAIAGGVIAAVAVIAAAVVAVILIKKKRGKNA